MHYLSVLLLLIIINNTALAQQEKPFVFQQAENLGLTINSNKDLLLVFDAPKSQPLEVVKIRLEIEGKALLLSTPIIGKEKGTSSEVATFSWPLFDAALEGHLEWGKAILEQLDSQQLDSIVVTKASLQLSENSTLVSVLPISFLGGWNTGDEFWNRAAQYKLLGQQIWVNDSINFWKKEVLRTEALVALNQKAFDKAKASINNIKDNLFQACQDSTLVDSLLQVEQAITIGLDKVRNGQAITNTEKMRLAEQTTARSQLLLAINKKKDPSCAQTLQELLKQQYYLNNIKRQRKLLELQLNHQKNQSKTFQDLYEQTSQQLAVIVARLPK